MGKIKLFTHTDLDGIGCAILGILAYGKDNIDIEYCDYNDVNEKIKEYIINKQYLDYDMTYITDISITEDLAKYITNYHPEEYEDGFNLSENFMLYDHHPTALNLNKYWWCHVQINLNDKEKTSGTRMFYDYLQQNDDLEIFQKTYTKCINLEKFVEIVRKYDIWQWKKENDLIPKQLNDLFYIMGRNDFIETILYRLTNYDTFGFSDFDLQLLKYKQNDIDAYIATKNKELIVKDILVYKAGVIFGEQYVSETGNKLSEIHPELDFIAIINMSKAISYRNIGNKLDLGKDIAKIFGGGGHPNASGSPISDVFRNKVINELFKI